MDYFIANLPCLFGWDQEGTEMLEKNDLPSFYVKETKTYLHMATSSNDGQRGSGKMNCCLYLKSVFLW